MSNNAAAILSFLTSAMGKDDRPASLWPTIEKHLAEDLGAFYSQIQNFPELSDMIHGPAMVESLKQRQREHWQKTLGQEATRESQEASAKLGGVHARVGLPLSWYVSAYGWLLMRMIPRLTSQHRLSKRTLDTALKTLVQRMFVDMALSSTAYESGILSGKQAHVEREGDLRNLKNLSGTVADVNDVAFDLAYLTRNTDEMAGNAQAIASSAAELVASVEEISRNSEGAAHDAAESDQSVEFGRRSVQAVAEAIGNIAGAVEETARSVDALSDASTQIGQILTVIEGIAEQTNLLALNATIEAARAGAAGKGFAVVAAEVKGLAGQTSKSTEDIAHRIASLREGMSAILSTMNRSKSAVVEGQAAIEEANSTMQTIAAQVGSVSDKMKGVADILSQQKGASMEIARNIDQVARTATYSREVLGKMSGKLHDSNTRFADSAKSWFKADSHRALCEMAKIDHVLFKKRVVDSLMGREGWDAGSVPDHHGCRLGKWYDSVQVPEIKALSAYRNLVEPHQRVHAAAKKALVAQGRGDMDGAMAALGEMNVASQDVLGVLDELSESLFGELAQVDRREYERQKVEKRIAVEVGGETRSLTVKDISRGGAKIEGLTSRDIGKPVRLTGHDACCEGVTVWSDGNSGGVQFRATAAEEAVRKLVLRKS
ncbi:MAG: CZB domain-containing protein [Hyphomicrobiaceae bacterium]|nr:CZB domain-containing protein [Hyphomicrobiaceae bacterium]